MHRNYTNIKLVIVGSFKIKFLTVQTGSRHIDRFQRVICCYSTIMWLRKQIQQCFGLDMLSARLSPTQRHHVTGISSTVE